MKRNKEIRFRLTQEEKDALVESARSCRLTQSSFVRLAIKGEVLRLKTPPASIIDLSLPRDKISEGWKALAKNNLEPLSAAAKAIFGKDFPKIKKNAILCKNCGSVIESKYRHDFQICMCGTVGVDGGKDYLRRIGEDYEERSEYK